MFSSAVETYRKKGMQWDRNAGSNNKNRANGCDHAKITLTQSTVLRILFLSKRVRMKFRPFNDKRERETFEMTLDWMALLLKRSSFHPK
jgi:hypothetical protein